MKENEAYNTCFGKPYIVPIEEHEEAKKIIEKCLEEIQAYRAIGTVEEFKALKEKSVGKKPQEISWGATNCSICGQEFGFNSHFNYCSNCGQKLDWGE